MSVTIQYMKENVYSKGMINFNSKHTKIIFVYKI